MEDSIRHYIRTDFQAFVVDGWSSGPHPERDASGAICIAGPGEYPLLRFLVCLAFAAYILTINAC